MAHILAKLKNVPFDLIEKTLKADAAKLAEQGIYLEHLWQNADNPNEILFLSKVDDLQKAKEFTDKMHAQARAQNPDAILPDLTFLED